MELNKNNFLRWDGEFIKAPVTNTAVNDVASMFVNQTEKKILPLVNDISTLGVDLSSFEITQQPVGVILPSTWNLVTSEVTFYLPPGSSPGTKTIKYKWKDLIGNLSNEGTITITINPRLTGWRVYPPSGGCQIVSGEKTGFFEYDELEKYYTDNNTTVTPLVTKPNSPGDPNYSPPFEDSRCSTEDFIKWGLGLGENSSSSCFIAIPSFYYTNPDDGFGYLTPGVQLFQDEALTTPAANGFYSDQTQWWQVFAGIISDQGFC